MNSYIKSIQLFHQSGDKRSVGLTPGVNIISGESKTGKSALVEIIDYCFCSSRCTVPKGKITDFAYLYVLVMEVDDHCLVIARRSWLDGAKMYVEKERSDFNPDHLMLTYFNEKHAISSKAAMHRIEESLGLSVQNLLVEEGETKRASLRNMVSYLFQHQNLIASKFALFYRFSDYYKRKDAIEQFPIFAGMISQEYYSDLIRLNSLRKELKQKQKEQLDHENGLIYIRSRLLPLINDYYALLDFDPPRIYELSDIIKTANNLPVFDNDVLFSEAGILERYHLLNKEIEDLRDIERDLLLKIESLEATNGAGEGFSEMLNNLKERTEVSRPSTETYECPLCGASCPEINELDEQVNNATIWLEQELTITRQYAKDFSEDRRILDEELKAVTNRIKETWKQIKTIDQKYLSSKELSSKKEKANYAKAQIELQAEIITLEAANNYQSEIDILKESIATVSQKIQGYKIDQKIRLAEQSISTNMNNLAKTLDFENEYRPVNLSISLDEKGFDLYQLSDHEKIYLSEMGSGANWVSCHIALFLSFLRFFASQNKSPMPLIMFFDQPSQVYFPQEDQYRSDDIQKDIEAVNMMYKTVFDEVNSIAEMTGVTLQMLIVDHVSGENLAVRDEFSKYLRANWRNGQALI